MNKQTNHNDANDDEQIVELLSNAASRTPAPAEARQRAFENIHAQWSRQSQQKKTKRRFANFGIAATMFLALAITWAVYQDSAIAPPTEVGYVARTAGTKAHVLPANSTWWKKTSLTSTVTTQQHLRTGSNSRVAINWASGGSLRMDENTEVEILSADNVRLLAGTVYFDSGKTDPNINAPHPLTIETPRGPVTHVGTQFLVAVDIDEVSVSVREGSVRFNNPRTTALVDAGEQLSINRSGNARTQLISSYGHEWAWVSEISPGFDSDTQSATDVIEWVSRETGYAVRFADEQSQQMLEQQVIKGIRDLSPIQTLDALGHATDLTARVADGAILIERK